ncbi:MAG: hypothetical protein ACFE0I_14680 [Elainellaceae cyanobacterium]
MCPIDSRQGIWVNREWEQICGTYFQGGIQGLVDRIFEAFDSIAYLNLDQWTNSSFQPQTAIAYQDIFDENFTKPTDETAFQEPSPVSYILKKIRSQWMQFIFLFSFFSVLGIAGRRQIMRHITAPLVTGFKASPWISTGILLVLIVLLIKFLVGLYQHDRDMGREKEAKKLRDGLCNHYQNLVKSRLSDKLIQRILTELFVEEERINYILDSFKNNVNRAIADAKSGSSSKIRTASSCHDLPTLDLDLQHLHKLRGMIR